MAVRSPHQCDAQGRCVKRIRWNLSASFLILATALVTAARTQELRGAAPAGVIAEYAATVHAAVKARLYFRVPAGFPAMEYAEFTVDLLPDGRQAGEPSLGRSCGLPGFDEAARKAIMTVDPFPKRADGSVPRRLVLRLYPQQHPASGPNDSR